LTMDRCHYGRQGDCGDLIQSKDDLIGWKKNRGVVLKRLRRKPSGSENKADSRRKWKGGSGGLVR